MEVEALKVFRNCVVHNIKLEHQCIPISSRITSATYDGVIGLLGMLAFLYTHTKNVHLDTKHNCTWK